MTPPDLIVPVQGNHNATLFLLGHTINKPGAYAILLSKTDIVADKLITNICHKLGIEIFEGKDIEGRRFQRVFVHPWNTESHPLSRIKFEELWVYADGMSNRVALSTWREARGFLFWGSTAPFGATNPESKQIFELSSIESQVEIWSMLLRNAGLKPRQSYVDQLEGKSLVAMRYWGSSTYFPISAKHVSETLNQFARATEAKEVLVKTDSRWQLPISQRNLIRRSFPNSRVKKFSNSPEEVRKLGHLASLDTYIFTCQFPSSDFLGFDGSLPPTIISAQKAVRVFVPEMNAVMDPGIPIHSVVLENLAWHKAVLENQFISAAGRPLVNGQSLINSLNLARGEGVANDEEFGKLVRSMLYSNHLPVTKTDLGRVQKILAIELAKASRRSAAAWLVSRLKASKTMQRIFYSSAQYLPLRRLLVFLSRTVSRLIRQ